MLVQILLVRLAKHLAEQELTCSQLVMMLTVLRNMLLICPLTLLSSNRHVVLILLHCGCPMFPLLSDICWPIICLHPVCLVGALTMIFTFLASNEVKEVACFLRVHQVQLVLFFHISFCGLDLWALRVAISLCDISSKNALHCRVRRFGGFFCGLNRLYVLCGLGFGLLF